MLEPRYRDMHDSVICTECGSLVDARYTIEHTQHHKEIDELSLRGRETWQPIKGKQEEA